MTLNLNQIRCYVVIPTLTEIGLYSHAAEQLVMATGMAESLYQYIDQSERGGDKKPGPAYGLWQMERPTHDDIWRNYIDFKKPLAEKMRRKMILGFDGATQMQGNMYYACAMCRIHYLRVPASLPDINDRRGHAEYWKKYYNTYLGAGTIDQFLKKTKPVWDLYDSL